MYKTKTVAGLLGLLVSVSVSSAWAQWGYECNIGPSCWGLISPAYSACSQGLEQTPIAISTCDARRRSLPNLHPTYSTANLTVTNNGHTIQAIPPPGSQMLRVGPAIYNVLQFHWHTPSEHFIDGGDFPMELHIVHQDSNGALLVIGAMVVEGATNAELERIFSNLPHNGQSVTVSNFDVSKILPHRLRSYRYSGSLTTPPCSEGVSWVVLAQPVVMSHEQIMRFKDLFEVGTAEFPDGNRRPLKPLNGRVVSTDSHGGHDDD